MVNTDIDITVDQLEPDTYQLVFKNQRDLAQSMMRLQEYYEGASDEIRGQYFTLEQFLHHFTDTNGQFNYTHTWSGFNVPGAVVERWYRLFRERDGLTHKEQQLMATLIQARGGAHENWYLIAATDGARQTIKHELAHARYYLKEDYRTKCDELTAQLPSKDRKMMRQMLIKMGYADEVIPDEIQAYLATSTRSDLDRWFKPFSEDSAAIIKQFRQLFKETTP